MAAKTRVWVGSQQIQEQAGSPHYTETAAGEKMVRTFVGPYTALFATRPRVGNLMKGYDGFFVEEVTVVPDAAGPSGSGTMVATLTNTYLNPDKPLREIEFTEITKPLEQAPIYAAGGAQALSDLDLDQISEWKSADTAQRRSTLYGGLSAHAKHFVGKLRKGQDSFVVFAPVHRETRRSFAVPTTTKCGKKVGAPTNAPPGYEWLQTADRANNQGGSGKWERVIEKTGADKVDTDIYPPDAP